MGPRGRQGRRPEGNQIINNIPQNEISFDKEAFNNMIRSQGIKMVHYRAIPDPRGSTSRGDNRYPNLDRTDSDGYIYKEAGCFIGLFMGNQNDSNLDYNAVIESASAYITLPDYYEDGKEQILVSQWDRFYFKDIETRVVGDQLVESSATGTDRLQYPATCVEYVIDADGVEYDEGKDFEVTKEGHIRWLGQKRPGTDPLTNRGKIYSIRYRYIGFFVCHRILHEIRVSQVTNPATFDRSLERMPYQILALREKIMLDVNRPDKAQLSRADESRLQYAPSSGGALGPK